MRLKHEYAPSKWETKVGYDHIYNAMGDMERYALCSLVDREMTKEGVANAVGCALRTVFELLSKLKDYGLVEEVDGMVWATQFGWAIVNMHMPDGKVPLQPSFTPAAKYKGGTQKRTLEMMDKVSEFLSNGSRTASEVAHHIKRKQSSTQRVLGMMAKKGIIEARWESFSYGKGRRGGNRAYVWSLKCQ